jgi:hypothetical protein
VVCHTSDITRPPFRSSNVWRVNYELIVFLIVSCCSFKRGYIRTVTHFSLTVTSPNIKII